MELFKKYRRKQVAELRELQPGENKAVLKEKRVSISDEDMKLLDADFAKGKVARNPANYLDKWYINAEYVANNFEPME